MQSKQNPVHLLAALGMMTALVFVSNYFSVPVASSRIHMANAVCLLAGLLFGGVRGFVAAGLGSALFDLTFPAYAAEAWITFINKGMMALVCGLLARGRLIKNAKVRVPAAALLGAAVYIALYLFKSYIQKRYITPIPVETLGPVLVQKLTASLINGSFGVLASSILYFAIHPALKKARLIP